MVHERIGADHQQHDHQGRKTAAPGAEHAGHLLFVRVGSRTIVRLAAEPGVTAIDAPKDADQNIKDVERGQFPDIERIEKAHPLRPAHHRFLDFGQREEVEDGDDDNRVNEITEQPLDAVGDHRRQLAAQQHDNQGKRKETGHQQAEYRPVHAEKLDIIRQLAVVHQETAADRRKQRVIQQTGQEGQETGQNPEAARMAHFKELGHRHGPRLPVAVNDEPGQGQKQRDDGAELSPEIQRITGFVIVFEKCDN